MFFSHHQSPVTDREESNTHHVDMLLIWRPENIPLIPAQWLLSTYLLCELNLVIWRSWRGSVSYTEANSKLKVKMWWIPSFRSHIRLHCLLIVTIENRILICNPVVVLEPINFNQYCHDPAHRFWNNRFLTTSSYMMFNVCVSSFTQKYVTLWKLNTAKIVSSGLLGL